MMKDWSGTREPTAAWRRGIARWTPAVRGRDEATPSNPGGTATIGPADKNTCGRAVPVQRITRRAECIT